MVQVLATQWKTCQTKTSQETETNFRKFLLPSQKRKVIHTYNLLEFGKYCEELSWGHRTITLHRSETSGFAKELYVEQKKRHHPYYCNLDRMISGRIQWNAITICEMTKTSWQTGNLRMNEDLGNHSRTCFVRD